MKKWPRGIAVLIMLVLLAGLIQTGPAALYGADASTEALDKLLQGVIALYVDSPTALVNNREIKLDAGTDFVTPLLLNNRVLVPVRFIAESLGGQVQWQESSKEITISLGGKAIRLTLHKPEIEVAGEKKQLETAPELYQGRTYVPLRAVSEAFGKQVDYKEGLVTITDRQAVIADLWEPANVQQISTRINKLPVLGSADNLKKLLEEAQSQSGGIRYGLDSIAIMKQAEAAPTAADSGSNQYSQTNTQVRGVDEADLVKTDGQYIYQVSGHKVIISKAYPAESLKVTAVLISKDENFTPQELYVDQENLVVIGSTQSNRPGPLGIEPTMKMIYPPYYFAPKVKAVIYDIRDKQNISQIRELELDGNYISSRKIGSALYLAANQNINYYPLGAEPILRPAYKDSAISAEAIEIPYSQIRCFPPVHYPNYLIIAGLDLSKPEEAAQISTYLGSGENIYVSEKHLYVAVTQHSIYPGQPGILGKIAPDSSQEKTSVYKFALEQGKVTYLQKGEVPGRILNQFSMDEFQDNFRIATTVGYSWSSAQVSRNNLYVLDSSLAIVGRLEDIAPGEQIYSTRFMGERAFMVTFKTVDPLFVIDLQDPAKPAILGALKIPGYSDYLHPYDANHLIGFGKDTIELPQKDYKGKVIGSMAYYLGMKIALFDVTDVANPKELYVEKIGDRGTTSELLYNHKALLFDKERGLLAFPVTVMKSPSGDRPDPRTGIPEYGQFAFQGAYIYSLDKQKGFSLQGTITHLTAADYQKAGNYGTVPEKEVNRIITIGDNLYTLSPSQIKANAITGLTEKGSLKLSE